jgi:hypothetical protein
MSLAWYSSTFFRNTGDEIVHDGIPVQPSPHGTLAAVSKGYELYRCSPPVAIYIRTNWFRLFRFGGQLDRRWQTPGGHLHMHGRIGFRMEGRLDLDQGWHSLGHRDVLVPSQQNQRDRAAHEQPFELSAATTIGRELHITMSRYYEQRSITSKHSSDVAAKRWLPLLAQNR